MVPGLEKSLAFWGVIIAAGILGWALTGLVLQLAARCGHLAVPTSRGLHLRATPVGGGLGFVATACGLWVFYCWPIDERAVTLLLPLMILLIVSVADDLKSLPAWLRLGVQIAAVTIVLLRLPEAAHVFSWVPLEVERFVIGFFWVWLINVVNFMDGSDGFAGVEAIGVAGGYAIVSFMLGTTGTPIAPLLPWFGALLAAGVAGFLIWNWAPAQIFMGDAGSIPLGFLFGVFALDLALRGAWMAGVILPLYFIFDATLTLLHRMARRARFWQPHREHAYQRAILGGMKHDMVAGRLVVVNVILIALAVISLYYPFPSLAAAIVVALVLYGSFMVRGAKRL